MTLRSSSVGSADPPSRRRPEIDVQMRRGRDAQEPGGTRLHDGVHEGVDAGLRAGLRASCGQNLRVGSFRAANTVHLAIPVLGGETRRRLRLRAGMAQDPGSPRRCVRVRSVAWQRQRCGSSR